MQSEAQCPSSERYLYAEEYLSDEAIKTWQQECAKRFKDREKDVFYDNYINWVRQDNQIAVYTSYAYADFDLPKKFDCIFQRDNPSVFLKIDYELTQCILWGWYPSGSISHGHHNLSIFTFKEAVPDVCKSLRRVESEGKGDLKGQNILGFCHSADFPAIAQRCEQMIQ